MKQWNPLDVVVIVLIALVGLVLIGTMANVVVNHLPESQTREKLITSIVVTMLGIVGVYVGSKIKDSNEKD